MATRIVLRNGYLAEVEESLDAVHEVMRNRDNDNDIGRFHVANGAYGWNTPDQEQPIIVVRGNEIALAFSIMDLPNPLRRRE